jgi:hypothetical protein
MPRKEDPLDQIYNLDVRRAALFIFGVAFLTRTLLNYVFFERFGYRAMQYPEIWFYYGVAKGKFQLLALDPTGIILKAVNALFGDLLVYGIVFAGIVLSSLAAVFIFLLVKEIYDSKTGIMAGLLYAALSFPASVTTAGFTHDIVAVPVIVLTLYFALLTGKGGGIKTLLPMLLLIAVGASINPMIIFGVFAVLVYFALKNTDDYTKYKNSLLWITAGAIFVRIMFYQDILNYIAKLAMKYRGIDLLSQLGNSADLAPPDIEVLLVGYNFLLLLALFGFGEALKKRDSMSLSMLLAGLLAISAISKGTRVLDIGMCMVAAVGFVNMKKYRGFATQLLLIFVITNITIGVYYSPPGFTKTEHEIFTWLEANTEPGETLYAKWTYGYTLQALSNLEPVSTPERIRPEIYSILWVQDEDVMVQGMTLLGANYILVSDEDFYYYEDSQRFALVMKESIFPPQEFRENAGAALLPVIKRTMIYRLMYAGDLEHFTMIGEWTDPITGVRYRAYELNQ